MINHDYFCDRKLERLQLMLLTAAYILLCLGIIFKVWRQK